MSTWAEHIAWCIDSARNVDIPDDLRALHQPDPNRIEERAQCVCTCGASCASYAGHLAAVAAHRELWNRLCTEHRYPLETFVRAGIDPQAWRGEHR